MSVKATQRQTQIAYVAERLVFARHQDRDFREPYGEQQFSGESVFCDIGRDDREPCFDLLGALHSLQRDVDGSYAADLAHTLAHDEHVDSELERLFEGWEVSVEWCFIQFGQA